MSDEAERNREIVRRAFTGWEGGEGDIFDLFAPSATFTIKGSGPSARTYRGKADIIENSIEPLFSRLEVAVAPRLIRLWAEDDQVVVRWDSRAERRDGLPYLNSYAWFLTLQDERIVAVDVFLDLPAYDALLAEVEPRPT